MKTIGLIGGMSWESTLEYYRTINEAFRKKLGENHSGEMVIYSFNFQDIVELQNKGEWNELEDMLVGAGRVLKYSGAELLLICANTMNKLAERVEKKVDLPLLHIVDATAEVIEKEEVSEVILLGTKYVMEEDFYKMRLERKYGLKVVVPSKDHREKIHHIIYHELCKGVLKEDSKKFLLDVIHVLKDRGSQGVILGCTELPMIVDQKDLDVPLFDTTKIHSLKAVDLALDR